MRQLWLVGLVDDCDVHRRPLASRAIDIFGERSAPRLLSRLSRYGQATLYDDSVSEWRESRLDMSSIIGNGPAMAVYCILVLGF